MTTDILHPGGRPCPQCGTGMAGDQRYCLACGARAADARLPFASILAERREPEILPAAAGMNGSWFIGAPLPRAETTADRLRANAGLIAGVGVLLLAMLVGVLIGSQFGGGDGDLAKALANQKPQVIQVGGVAAAPAAAPAADSGAADTASGDATPAAKKTAKSASAAAGGSAPATNSAVKKLDNLSGKAYQKQIDKLGKTIPTGGKAPPKDNKPAAGGGSFEEIG